MKDPAGADMHDREVISAETLFRQHATWVAKYLNRLGFRGQDVEDIVQDTFLVAHRRGGFRPGEARPTTWLAEIALRISMARRRAAWRAPVADPAVADSLPASSGDPLARAIDQEALSNVQRALDTLPIERRALFVLFELEGESCEALSSTFEVPIGTIYSRLHKARSEFLAAHRRLTDDRRRA